MIAAVIQADLELSKERWLLSLVCIEVGIENVNGRAGSFERLRLIGHTPYTFGATRYKIEVRGTVSWMSMAVFFVVDAEKWLTAP